MLGLDLAEPALARARARARDQRLGNVEFRVGDIGRTGLPESSVDAVICVFGIFFLADMRAGLTELRRVVRPGLALAAPEDWWAIVLGTGYRATIERLGAAAAARIRADNLA